MYLAGPGAVYELVATDRPEAPALISDRGALTYAELATEVDAATAALLGCGLRPGDRVAATSDRPEDVVVAFLSAQRAGLVWVGVNRGLAPAEKAFLARDAGAAVFLADAATAAELADLGDGCRVIALDETDGQGWSALCAQGRGTALNLPPVDLHAPAALAYTSGTTGRPKGVILSQHNITTFPVVGLSSDRGETWAPGLRRCATVPVTILNVMIFGPLSALFSGGAYVCADRSDARSIAELIERQKVEVINTVGTTAFDLVTRADLAHYDLSSLRAIGAGGASVSDELKDAVRKRFDVELVEEYGLTEAPCSLAGGHSAVRAPAGAVGTAYPHLEVAAVTADGAVLPAGETGEICARPATTGPWAGVYRAPAGYWGKDNPALTVNGWLRTGDLGYLDDDGFLRIVGRIKDVILRGGANVYPAEIERVLRMHPQVVDVVVLAMPDPRLGEVAGAFLEVTGEVAGLRSELTNLCGQHLARYKQPERWFLVPEFPRNAMSKPDKAVLQSMTAAELD